METETMTIHRALVELKLIDSKIEKKINVIEPLGVNQEGRLINGLIEVEKFKTDAKRQLQSVKDLINRKCKIKSAIVQANGVTKIKISDKEMTIADAINFKNVIELKTKLIERLEDRSRKVKGLFIKENERVNQVALDNAKIMIGKQGDDGVKATDEDVKAIIEPFVKRNEYHLSDPLDADKLIEDLNTEVDNFTAEVDAVLSEINAITIIEV